VYLQRARHSGNTLSAVETIHGRLLELFGEFFFETSLSDLPLSMIFRG
jgi:hypothetical protein